MVTMRARFLLEWEYEADLTSPAYNGLDAQSAADSDAGGLANDPFMALDMGLAEADPVITVEVLT